MQKKDSVMKCLNFFTKAQANIYLQTQQKNTNLLVIFVIKMSFSRNSFNIKSKKFVKSNRKRVI